MRNDFVVWCLMRERGSIFWIDLREFFWQKGAPTLDLENNWETAFLQSDKWILIVKDLLSEEEYQNQDPVATFATFRSRHSSFLHPYRTYIGYRVPVVA